MSITYTPTTVNSGFNVTEINTNFTAIQTALSRAIDRGATSGGNAMQQNLDLGSNNIINGGVGNFTNVVVGGVDLTAQVAAAAASAAAASASETAAAASAATASTQASNASASATLASQWAMLTGAQVAATDYSAKEYAVGTFTRGSIGSSKDWATYLGGSVNGSEYSSRAWARSDLIRGLANGGSARNWATYTGGTADDTEYSAKEYAIGTTVATGSAKDWAQEAEDVLVDGSGYSAFHWAQKAMAIVGGVAGLVSSNDTTADYLVNKFTALHGLTWTELNDGGNEDLQLSIGTHLEIGGGTNHQPLNIYKADSNAVGIHLSNLTTGNLATDGAFLGLDASEQLLLWNYENTPALFGIGADEKMRLTTNGNLLFDTTADASGYRIRCHDAASSGAQYIRFGNTTTGTLTSRGIVIGMDASENMVLENHESTEIHFHTNSAPRWKISNAGGLYANGATGGDQGLGTINASDILVDGNSLVGTSTTNFGRRGQIVHLWDSATDHPSFDIDAVIGITFESVGPTGSGATNTWTALDALPTTAVAVILRIYNNLSGSTNGDIYTQRIHGRKTGSGEAIGALVTELSRNGFTNRSGASELQQMYTEVIVPLDTSQRFDLAREVSGTSVSGQAQAILVGFLEGVN